MKKNIFTFILTILLVLIFISLCVDTVPTNVYAAGTANSNSDIQLLARAINGEARGESYEGQVAVRRSYFKSS